MTEDILKRIIKCYLYFQKEATATMIVKHIQEVGYGVKKIPEPPQLTKQMKQWRVDSYWFNVRWYVNKKGVTVFYLHHVTKKEGKEVNFNG